MPRRNIRFLAASLVATLAVFLIGLAHPHLMIEDGIVETVGAAGFAVAALTALGIAAAPASQRPYAERMIAGGVGAFAIALFLSEISFGARLFDLRMPRMQGGGEFDGSHDIAVVVYRAFHGAGTTGLVAAAGLVVGGAAIAGAMRLQTRPMALLRRTLDDGFEFRLALAVGLLACAVALDLIESHKAGILEEALEFNAGGVMIAAVLMLRRRSVPGAPQAAIASNFRRRSPGTRR